MYIGISNKSSNNYTDPYHEFEHESYNATKLIKEYGEPKKESNSSKYIY